MKILDKKYKVIALWFVVWLSVFGFYSLYLKPNAINYQDGGFELSAYFLIASLIGVKLLNSFQLIRVKVESFKVIAILLALFSIFIGLSTLTDYKFPVSEPRLLWFREIGVLFPFFSVTSVISKSADIFFQQALIISLVLKLREFGISDKQNMKLFSVLFFLLHAPLIIVMSYSAFLFILPSIIAGLIFSYLILSFKNGVVYSVGVHLLFYYCLGIILRTIDLVNIT